MPGSSRIYGALYNVSTRPRLITLSSLASAERTRQANSFAMIDCARRCQACVSQYEQSFEGTLLDIDYAWGSEKRFRPYIRVRSCLRRCILRSFWRWVLGNFALFGLRLLVLDQAKMPSF